MLGCRLEMNLGNRQQIQLCLYIQIQRKGNAMPKNVEFVEFEAIREAVTMPHILTHYGLLARMKCFGNTLMSCCPIHHGRKPRQFQVRLKDDTWRCLSECTPNVGASHVVDFVARMDGIGHYEAAKKIIEWFKLRPAILFRDIDKPIESLRERIAIVSQAIRDGHRLVQEAQDFNLDYFKKGRMICDVAKAESFLCENTGCAVDYWRRHIETAANYCPDQECFAVLLLSSQLRILGHYVTTLNLVDSVPVSRGEVFRAAVLARARGVVLMHNHPSGCTRPSKSDARATQILGRAGQILDIEVHDHIIVCPTSYQSMRELRIIG
ncbi:MAG: JAB domain-containing protein [Patescibacteria group bacterium]